MIKDLVNNKYERDKYYYQLAIDNQKDSVMEIDLDNNVDFCCLNDCYVFDFYIDMEQDLKTCILLLKEHGKKIQLYETMYDENVVRQENLYEVMNIEFYEGRIRIVCDSVERNRNKHVMSWLYSLNG